MARVGRRADGRGMSAEGLPPGIRRRHARTCPALDSDDMAVCKCRPTYQAQAGPRRDRRTKTARTLGEAKSWKRDTESAFASGGAGGRAPTVEVAAKDWLAKAEAGIARARGDKPYRPSTLRGYRQAMAAHLYPEDGTGLGKVRLDVLTRKQINQFVEQLVALGLAPQTVRNVVIPLRAIYRYQLDFGDHVHNNPTWRVRVPAGGSKRLTFADVSEIGPLLAALEEGDRALWATALYAGLRRGELMALTWRDVDLAAGVVTVRHAYDAPSKTTGDVKSEAGQDRRVPIVAALRDELVEHRHRVGGRPVGLVFARGRLSGQCRAAAIDMPFSDQAVATRAARRWAAAGVRPVTLHDCRHTFASLMIAAMAASGTFDPKAIQQMLGHASIQQTYDRYGHLFPGAEQRAGRMLDEFLAAGAEATELSEVVSRLRTLLSDADPDLALPAVTEAHDLLSSWLLDNGPLPSVTLQDGLRAERQATVQRRGDSDVR